MKEILKVSLDELLTLERRAVEVNPTREYAEIGVYCFGKGLFHKSPRTGLEVGDKKLFLIKAGDFILQVTFAWEGAVALATAAEDGMYGSTRFLTFRVDEARCFPQYLVNYFRTPSGLEQLIKISPGSAGRNRVLSLKRIPEVAVPLPPLDEQRRVVARIEELVAKVEEARGLRSEAVREAELLLKCTNSHILDSDEWQVNRLETVLTEPPRNGLSPQRVVETEGRPMLRINAVSSSLTRYVDLSAHKLVDVSDDIAQSFTLQNDDVFIVRYNGDINRLAKAAIFKATEPSKVVYPDKLMRLRADLTKILPDFLVYVLGSRRVRTQVEESGITTAGQIGISGKNAKSFLISLPPIPEQSRIVSYLDDLQAKVDTLKQLQSETEAELNALLPSILDKAFKGEL